MAIWWYFRWPFDGIKVGNTLTTGGHLVVFRLVEFMGPTFGNGQHHIWPQLPPMSKNQHGPSWASPVRPNVVAQLGPNKANVKC